MPPPPAGSTATTEAPGGAGGAGAALLRARVIGHRGAGLLAPENTLAALRLAAKLGLAAVEIDVRLSADAVGVLIHDARLERTTDGRGAVAATPLAAIKTLDAGRWFAPACAGEPVPTLDEAIAVLIAHGLGVNVEIKAEAGCGARAGAAVATRLAERWPHAHLPCLISSFDPAALAAAASVAPILPRALIADQLPADWRARRAALDLAAVHCRATALGAAEIAALTAAGVAWRCYTVDDPHAAARLLARGCAGIFTDRPDRLAGLLATAKPAPDQAAGGSGCDGGENGGGTSRQARCSATTSRSNPS